MIRLLFRRIWLSLVHYLPYYHNYIYIFWILFQSLLFRIFWTKKFPVGKNSKIFYLKDEPPKNRSCFNNNVFDRTKMLLKTLFAKEGTRAWEVFALAPPSASGGVSDFKFNFFFLRKCGKIFCFILFLNR